MSSEENNYFNNVNGSENNERFGNKPKPTKSDIGWYNKAMDQGRKPTMEDEGWAPKASGQGRKPTMEDKGWAPEAAGKGRKPTMEDKGWAPEAAGQGRKPTMEDEGWAPEAAGQGRKPTMEDEGWAPEAAGQGRVPVRVNSGRGRKNAAGIDLAEIMSRADAKFFPDIDAFRAAVNGLQTLTSANGKVYSVERTLSTEGGESVILLCSDPAKEKVVAKVFFKPVKDSGSSIETRVRVLEYMRTEEGKRYTLAVSDIGLVEFGDSNYYFEIMPYCSTTDLSDDGAYSFSQIEKITKQLNEALHSIHQAGICHRDIKPENLYWIDDRVKIGDFGIAMICEVGQAQAANKIVGTAGYAAPETRLYNYSAKCDYFSLGITLASLFEGHYLYRDLNFEMMVLAQGSETLPLSRQDPKRELLENLLKGLTRFTPSQRFGYEEVNRWLADHNYAEIVKGKWPNPFYLFQEKYFNEKSLFFGITKDEVHWNEALELLYRKNIEGFFVRINNGIARQAQLADEQYRGRNRDKGLAVFLKYLYPAGPIVWKGYTFKSLSELGAKMAATKTPGAYGEMLQNQCISHWLRNTEGINVNEETIKLVDKIEELSIREPELACYWFGNAFAPERTLTINGTKVSDLKGMFHALFQSSKKFYEGDGCKKLMDRKTGADLYGFLYSFGFREAVEKSWESVNKCDDFYTAVILFSMLDDIAVKASLDPTLIRKFFLFYGPVGLAVYLQKLAGRQDDPVYLPLNKEGQRMLSQIVHFKASSQGSVSELYRAFHPLLENMDSFSGMLVENPHCILSGVYENKGVIAANLMGCFAFEYLGRAAPLGFHAWITEFREV